MGRTLLCGVLVAVACSCGSSQESNQPVFLTMENSGSTVELDQGDHLIITLTGNPSTGFGWLLQDYDDLMLTLMDEGFIDKESGRVGAAGDFFFEFEATGSGETDVELQYRRSWEDAPAERVFMVRVVVG